LVDSHELPAEFHEWLDLTEIASELGIHPQSARRLLKNGRLTGAVLFAGKYLMHRDKLREFKERGYDPRPGRKPTRRLL
jgi:hypothetical protein